MKLKLIPPPHANPIYIANVHRTGKIGFTIAAANHFQIDTSKSMALGVNEDDANDKNIYGVLFNDANNPNGYKIMKAGEYHSVNAKSFFEEIGISYDSPISFVVTNFEANGSKMLKFTKRETKTAANGQK